MLVWVESFTDILTWSVLLVLTSLLATSHVEALTLGEAFEF